MAVLFALDRAAPRTRSRPCALAHDVVILDRYVASNAAYSAARLHQGIAGEVVPWVGRLEYDRFALPGPTARYCSTPQSNWPLQRARHRAEQEADRARDAYERDDGLQQRTGAVYAELAAADWGGAWSVVAPDVDPAPAGPVIARRVNVATRRVVAGVCRDSVTPWTP